MIDKMEDIEKKGLELLDEVMNGEDTQIIKKFNDGIGKISFCDYETFTKLLDEIIAKNPEFTLKKIKPYTSHKTLDNMIRDIIKEGLLPDNKDIIYRVIYVNRFYDDVILKTEFELEKMKRTIKTLYDLVIEEMNKDRSKFKIIYDNKEKYNI